MRPVSPAVNSSTVFEIAARDGVGPTLLEALLSYDARDPYAVQVAFQLHHAPVRWLFARDLLRDGMIFPTGPGDVRIRPSASNSDRIEFTFASPSGQAWLTTDAAVLRDFLQQTFEAVPAGDEPSVIDMDLVLSSLLSDPSRSRTSSVDDGTNGP